MINMSCRDPEFLAELRSFVADCIETGHQEIALEDVLNNHIQDFETALEAPKKADDARRTVQSGACTRPKPEHC